MTTETIPNLTAYDDAALDQAFAALADQASRDASLLGTREAVETFRLEWLGRKQGRLNEVSGRWLKSAPAEAKKSIGQRFNELKKQVEDLLEQASWRRPERRCACGGGHRHHAAWHARGSPARSTPSRAR